MKIAFLACAATLPGAVNRRVDAFEHDHQVAALRPSLRKRGASLVEIDWRAPDESFADFDAAIIGTTWDYQNHREEFLQRLDAIEAMGTPLFNAAALVRWNVDKTYLVDLAEKGVRTIPTLWPEKPTRQDVELAFETFGADKIVLKRQTGAGAEGQKLIVRGDALDEGPLLDRPGMIQPFLPSIESEGEYSFIFIDSVFSHALIKRAAPGDYRIQSAYGGVEAAAAPSARDLRVAQAAIERLPGPSPLYARIDMVRGDDGGLLLMEAELIEPYLYPLEGPELGERMAQALVKRLG